MSLKRVLWICNHTMLMDCECPLLLRLGFEVFVPKKNGTNIRNMTVSYAYDESLSILPEDIATLNEFDFYSSEYTYEISRIINKYFVLAICINIQPALFNLVKNLEKTIVIRAFGYEGTTNYESSTKNSKKPPFISRIFKPPGLMYHNQITHEYYRKRDRIYLGVAYEEIIPNETSFFRERCAYLPLGISKSIWEQENTWSGEVPIIMFVCPDVSSAYYEKVFVDFILQFGDLRHCIYGKQNGVYLNTNIVGFQDRNVYNEHFKKNRLMFYHSREERHLHYHPLESIVFGMPVVFMSGGGSWKNSADPTSLAWYKPITRQGKKYPISCKVMTS